MNENFFSLFTVDTSAAGRGKLDFQVTCRGHDVPTRLREIGPERYDFSFTPQQAAQHRVHVNFNDMQVPGESSQSRILGKKDSR